MASASSKTLIDIFGRASKRLKPTLCKSEDNINSSSTLTVDQKSRIEHNKNLALSRKNRKICIERVSKHKESLASGCVKLEELLVEESWLEALPGEFQKDYAVNLSKFVETEICKDDYVYPPAHLIFNALNTTPFQSAKVVILGQDPYHGPGQAMGLSFSVPEGVKVPSSLVNIFKELKQDLGCSIPSHGNLEKWAVQGVLLLNAVLTVRKHQANSHSKKGWEQFTDTVIKTISQKKEGVVFLLWGKSAQEKLRLIDATKHHILKAAHPSGLSANRGFFGCRHFSQTNKYLEQMGIGPIDWQL
ncbi:putative uracil-DNA glycosylase [Medicago truncatula]|uniref:Uracil-DNA glycosylase n=1 Tax=Medicago truncatula TaxID=3880 RepID=A0A072UXG8_MEDTR|nr:uracil-DNA glycosylase, mitochondrial [Medicago truncatula]KEH30565.1 uracil-DNA glycosylase-like protein [Medicago truncatula]RHN61545.1 putative uracil-DNA glycosylase [Medicago truncatula]